MSKRKWSVTSFQRLEKLGLQSPVPPEWIEFEKESMTHYKQAQAQARNLLAASKTAEAAALLNATARKIWKDAARLLDIIK